MRTRSQRVDQRAREEQRRWPRSRPPQCRSRCPRTCGTCTCSTASESSFFVLLSTASAAGADFYVHVVRHVCRGAPASKKAAMSTAPTDARMTQAQFMQLATAMGLFAVGGALRRCRPSLGTACKAAARARRAARCRWQCLQHAAHAPLAAAPWLQARARRRRKRWRRCSTASPAREAARRPWSGFPTPSSSRSCRCGLPRGVLATINAQAAPWTVTNRHQPAPAGGVMAGARSRHDQAADLGATCLAQACRGCLPSARGGQGGQQGSPRALMIPHCAATHTLRRPWARCTASQTSSSSSPTSPPTCPR